MNGPTADTDSEPFSGPWRSRELVRLGLGEGIALAFVISGWIGASGVSSVRRGLLWLGISLTGLVIAGVSNGWWLLVGLRSVGGRASVSVPPVVGRASLAKRSEPRSRQDRLVSAAGMTRYHRAGCVLVQGREIAEKTASKHQAAGLRPCGVCEP